MLGLDDQSKSVPMEGRELLKEQQQSGGTQRFVWVFVGTIGIGISGFWAVQLLPLVTGSGQVPPALTAVGMAGLLVLLGLGTYGFNYVRSVVRYRDLEVHVSPRIVEPGDPVEMKVKLPEGRVDRTRERLEAFITCRRIWRNWNRGPNQDNPEILYERSARLTDVSSGDETNRRCLTVKWDIPDDGPESDYAEEGMLPVTVLTQWDVGVRERAGLLAPHDESAVFVVQSGRGDVTTVDRFPGNPEGAHW